VEWVFVDENIPIEEIYERGLSQKTMYKIDETALKMDFFTNNGQETLENINTQEKKYVLIIDEINRGNVSSIFGELITLIEKDKRAGCPEELEVILPYSKEPFKVPKNVFIIGTMNTADRSVEALDTALRRRFSFVEMMPDYEVLKEIIIEGINLSELLKIINDRIEVLLDRDHKIGHSYFINAKTLEDLLNTFKNNIIPLLQEYFYNDYEKIALVLGEGFVEINGTNTRKVNFPKLSVAIDKPEQNTTFNLKDEIEIKSAIESLMAFNE
jgi:5-methylcytosine-specific restriction protein B